jgi:hypothetical protein
MSPTKPWYESKTVWASSVTIMLSLTAALGLTHIGPVPVEQVEAQKESLVDLLTQIGLIASGLIALYGRLTANSAIRGRSATNIDPTAGAASNRKGPQ